ncbi:DUF6134 family protein [Methylovirgula sp. HY1]|uniref:DUF6134 family protein n=1 Tax=Methylovirgula sp. HY1 TaxID=2822761 RepID=UPI001C5BED19|nr:DUF6134 family protein [Methylovirgula sp. HY1]QXX74943.1 hypothetical protein MHY1_01760 [Methylovirgula sp. HY1]
MLKIFSLLLSFFFLAIEPAMAQTPPEPVMRRVFDITRNGNKIGTDIIEIEKNGDTTTIKSTTHISVVIMFVEAYHYEHAAVETWNAGQFVSYSSHTNDNGKKHAVTAMLVGDKFNLTADGKLQELPQVVFPDSLWNNDFVGQTQLFDTATGKILSIKVQDMGPDPIVRQGTTIQTERYKISGDLKRDIWLDGDVPLRIKLLGSDHSKIVSDLRR